jgi:hypothetical protein
MGREQTLERTKSGVGKERPDSQSDESEEEEGEVSIQEEWETSVGDVGELLDSLKQDLAQIDPGIGDKVTLAKFCAFIEANSSALK